MVWQAVVAFLKAVAINLAVSLAIAAIQGRNRSEGPRLQDLTVQTSTYGRFIPIVFGTPAKFSGNMIWLRGGEIDETRHKETVGDIFGIGGTDVITYTYAATFAVAVCDGPARIRRMWADTKLIYDEGIVTEEDLNFEINNPLVAALYSVGRLKPIEILSVAAGDFDGLRVYVGTEDQDPDFQILEEDADAPAYRNTCYVVFDNLQLEKYGNRIPQLWFEVVEGEGDTFPDRLTSNGPSPTHETPTDDPFEVDTEFHYPISFTGGVLRIQKSHRVTAAGNITMLDTLGNYIGQEYNSGILPQVPQVNLGFAKTNDPTKGGFIKLPDSTSITVALEYPAVLQWESKLQSTTINFDFLAKLGLQLQVIGVVFSADDSHMIVIDGDSSGSWSATQSCAGWYLIRVEGFNDPTLVDSGTFADGFLAGPGHFGFHKGGEAGDFGLGPYDWTSGCLENNLKYFWSVYSAGNGNVRLFWINEKNICDEVGPSKWTESGGGATGGVGNLIAGDNPWCYADAGKMLLGNGEWTGLFSRRPQVDLDATTDGSVITKVAQRAGLAAADIDVTERTSEVKGYAVGRLTTLGSIIEQVQPVTYFDVVESDMVLKFPSRGGASILTLTADDLAAHEFDQPRPQDLTHRIEQETSLPKSIVVSYPDRNRNYDLSEQYASRNVKSTERIDKMELQLVVDDEKAAQVADVSLYNIWSERNTYEFTLPYKYCYLDAGDLITIVLEQTYVMRLTEVQLGAGIIKCKGVKERPDLYNSAAVSEAGPAFQGKSFGGETHIEFLDIPILRDAEEDDAGFYIACGGYYGGWRGCQVHKAAVDGQAYDPLVSVLDETTMGYCTTVLADANNTTVPDDTTVTVKTFNLKTLTTATDFTANDNVAAIGDNGRWELIRFKTVTDNGDGTYTLSDLLRGYRGTEHNTALHDDLDKFILLSSGSLVRIIGDTADINVERTYKAVTIGDDITQALARTFTNTAIGLQPYAPVHILGSRDGSDNLTITWLRRSRSGYYWLNSEETPLDEDNENYDVLILNGSTVVRTIEVTSETATYTAAEQTTDFGSAQSAIDVQIYQISENTTIDRGIAGEATI